MVRGTAICERVGIPDLGELQHRKMQKGKLAGLRAATNACPARGHTRVKGVHQSMHTCRAMGIYPHVPNVE